MRMSNPQGGHDGAEKICLFKMCLRCSAGIEGEADFVREDVVLSKNDQDQCKTTNKRMADDSDDVISYRKVEHDSAHYGLHKLFWHARAQERVQKFSSRFHWQGSLELVQRESDSGSHKQRYSDMEFSKINMMQIRKGGNQTRFTRVILWFVRIVAKPAIPAKSPPLIQVSETFCNY